MITTFTQDDLIRYLYHETTQEEDQEIRKALLNDAELRAMYASITSIKKEMDSALLDPSPQIVMNILNYSKSISAVKQ